MHQPHTQRILYTLYAYYVFFAKTQPAACFSVRRMRLAATPYGLRQTANVSLRRDAAQPRQIAARQAAFRRRDGFGLGNPKSLERTIMVEAVLTTIVVAVSSTRRRRRQARRHTLSSASP